jgi:glucose-1-phosphate cytidylyltransferase
MTEPERAPHPDTPVIILCGGQGTRIRDVSESLPKPMVPIGDRPILWHIMRIYAARGYRRFLLALGYKGWVIKEYFLNYRAMTSDFRLRLGSDAPLEILSQPSSLDWSITFVETGEKTQTGGRVLACEKYVETEDFMVTYGDGLGDVDVQALHRFHREHGCLGTVTGVRPRGRFGAMAVEADAVTEFNEKQDAGGGLINGGFFVFRRGFFELLRRCGDTMLETDPMKELVSDRQLRMYTHRGFWEPMDTMREHLLLNRLWDSGSPPWKVWE